MKKIIASVAGILLLATSAFAAYQAIESGANIGATVTLNVKGSKGVMLNYLGDTTTPGQGYVMGAYHNSGTKTYGTSSGDTKMYYHDGTAIAIPSTVPTGSNTADFSGWTSL